MASAQAQNNPTKYFVFSKTDGTILSNYPSDPGMLFDEAIGISSFSYSVTETTTEFPTGQLDEDGNPITQAIVTGVEYSPTISTLSDFKKAAVAEISARPLEVSEVTLANGLVFDDTEKSLNYLQTKRATSNASEVVYDKYNTSATMSNSELTAAVSVIATSQMSKDDAYKAKVVEINNASSIDEVKDLAGMYKEKTIKLIVDVDVDHFDNTNQVTNEELNQVVLGDPGDLDLSDISWINGVGVKSINGQTEFVEAIDSNGVSTALLVFSPDSPVINGSLTADGLPVELELVVYCRNVVSGGSQMTQA